MIKITRKPSTSQEITTSLHILEGNAETVLDKESRLFGGVTSHLLSNTNIITVTAH